LGNPTLKIFVCSALSATNAVRAKTFLLTITPIPLVERRVLKLKFYETDPQQEIPVDDR
jgi:hypothetical protein